MSDDPAVPNISLLYEYLPQGNIILHILLSSWLSLVV